MKPILRFAISTALFAATALVGPLIRLLTWPPQRYEQLTSHSSADFIYHLVVLLWPSQLLAAMEINTGRFVAGLVAVGVNVLLFIILGIVAGASIRWRYGLLSLYVFVSALVLLFALWGAGFSLSYLNLYAIATALLIYAAPFIATSRIKR